MCRPLSYMWYDLEPEDRLELPEEVEEGPAPMINSLCQRLKDSSSTLVTTKELEGLSVDISRVQNSDDEVHFSPCFFRPNPVKFLRDFPLHPDDYERDLSSPPPCPSLAKAYERVCDFEQELNRGRKNLSSRFSWRDCDLLEFNAITSAGWHEPVTNFDHEWYVRDTLEANSYRRPGTPHLIGLFVCEINPDRDAQSLSVAELEAIGGMMVEQIWHGQHSIYPLLLLSFIGQEHGRVTQAVYWSTELHIQFSQLLSFESEGNELMELFCRYTASDMVGCEQSPLSISISGM